MSKPKDRIVTWELFTDIRNCYACEIDTCKGNMSEVNKCKLWKSLEIAEEKGVKDANI